MRRTARFAAVPGALAAACGLLLTCAVLGGLAAQEAGQRDLARLKVQEQDRAWLSIQGGGHTAAVRALAFTPDSRRLATAGLDKVVHVWDTSTAVRDLRRTRLLERTIRWQVARGLRGSIYAMAAAPDDGLLAIGGYGASGGLGEILLVDPRQGTLVKVLKGHRQTVCSLDFSSDGQWLASLDVAGQAMLWQRPDWEPSRLYAQDGSVYPEATAELIARQVKLRPIAADRSHVTLPVLVGSQQAKLTWKLQRIALDDRKDVATLPTVHQDAVTALATSDDGARMASADNQGNLYLWDVESSSAVRLARGPVVLSLAFSPDGRTLVAGTAVTGDNSQLQVWDTAARELRWSRPLADHVHACAISPNGRQVACAGGEHNTMFIGPLEDEAAFRTLGSAARRVVKVAFADEQGSYRAAFGTTFSDQGLKRGELNDYGGLEGEFDPVDLSLSGPALQDDGAPRPLNQDDWLDTEWSRGRWSAKKVGGKLQLYHDGAERGYVLFDTKTEGTILCYCWLTDQRGNPVAIAVGTDLQNSIYVCRLADRGACPILRHFRGHHDYLTSLGVSRDMRYLISGSADGTVRFWNLADYALGRQPAGRWGAQFAVRGGRLSVEASRPAGPLFFHGVRQGDVLERIRWRDGAGDQVEQRPDAILDRLSRLPWMTQVVFEFSRGGNAREAFQLVPAWQPLASLFVSGQREWAFWTPEGYYDASTNGHTLFGWQVNRGVDALPDFYRADQFRRNLERPDVMQELLPAGSLDEAFRRVAQAPPAEPDRVVQEQIDVTPWVSILSPRSGEKVAGGSTAVRAVIEMPPKGELARARVFANGVVAHSQRLVEERDGRRGRELVYEWQADLPSEERNLIQVVAGTSAQTVGFSHVLVEQTDLEPVAQRPARLYVLAVGIDTYRDPDVQPLAYSVADAQAVVAMLRDRTAGMYDLAEPTILLNDQVTLTTWRESFERLGEQLKKDARPDDLLVIFIAGHGFVDPASQQYYFASHDITRDDFVRGVYSGSISWKDFELLADVPCRKLAFLDTCHAGAIQPQRRNLKAAIRAFQEDVVFTVSASAGHERSEEKESWGHGAFTKTLLEALSGKADESADGIVSLNEVVQYVKRSVPELTAGRQNPTAAPDDLLPYVSIRLTNMETVGSN
ncbi:MAG: hypothetical protein WD847_03745 [Pirellulales bacterium]